MTGPGAFFRRRFFFGLSSTPMIPSGGAVTSSLVLLILGTDLKRLLGLFYLGDAFPFFFQGLLHQASRQGLLHGRTILLGLDHLADLGQQGKEHGKLNLLDHLAHQILLDQDVVQWVAQVLVYDRHQVRLQRVGGIITLDFGDRAVVQKIINRIP